MSKFLFVFKASIFVTIVCAFVTFSARAQATRTWVSGVGDDVNPCSRTAPCKTFAGAISKTAAGGEINCIDSGGYGTVTITKSITLDGTGCMASILASATTGIVINIPQTGDPARTVRIRALAINGAGTTPGVQGIKIISASRVYIEDTVIDGFAKDGISIENTWATGVYIKNTTIRNNGGAGINVKPTEGSATVSISNSYLEGNLAGLDTGATSQTTIQNSSLAGNMVGIRSKSDASVVGCVITNNELGVHADVGGTIRLSGATVTGSGTGLKITAGAKIISFRNNTIHGNTSDGAPTLPVTQQ